MRLTLTSLLLSIALVGCTTPPSKHDKPAIKADFGPVESHLGEFGKTYDEARAHGLTAEEKLKYAVEKARALEALENE